MVGAGAGAGLHRAADDRVGHLRHSGYCIASRDSVTWTLWGLSWLGIVLALYVFMADSLRTVHQGLDVTRQVLPKTFNWSVFGLALALMAAPVAEGIWRMGERRVRSPVRF